MKVKKIIIIICLIIILISPYLLFYIIGINPSMIFERKFGFKLPDSIKIEKHSFYYFDEEILFMKASFDEDDYAKLKGDLQNYFSEKGHEIESDTLIPTFIYACSWWDMNKDEIILGYYKLMSGKYASTKSVYVFITQNDEGQYFLYVVN